MHFSTLSMRRSRHPLIRAISLLLGLAVIGLMLVFGLVVAGVLLVGGLVLLAVRQWKMRNAPAAARTAHRPDVLEGEFKVIHQGRPVTHSH